MIRTIYMGWLEKKGGGQIRDSEGDARIQRIRMFWASEERRIRDSEYSRILRFWRF